MAESTYEKFRKLLAELFMFDRADLDFGIYRIMNAKRDEVTRFFDNDLLPQVKATLSEVDSGQRQQLQVELEEAEKAAGLAGFDPDDSPRVQDLRQALKTVGDPETLEAEVFSHLYSFFRRYYKDGDFISLRRYKEGVYAIPYEGEEVKLYWANHDQYYIKSGEYFRDYAFKLPDDRRVHFKLVQADEERDNIKAAAGQERRFILSESEAVREEDGELVIPFEYRPDEQKRKRDELVAQAAERILADEAAAAWLFGLAVGAPTEKNPKRTLLERHLNEYTARNSFDYFIHKDLGGFLRRELDFYIKNEVMHLDDIESEGEQRVIQYLAKIKAIRRIAHKIIDFLAQLENFQKKLWLKKKFVVEANYCVTLDRVPEELYPEIAASEAQREEWVRLFAIDEIGETLTSPGYSEPLTVAFLKANSFLVLDTAFFGEEFNTRLQAAFDGLDLQTDGLLVHADNFQGLRLLERRFRHDVRSVYIDPPYNTGDDDFPYKDGYQASSWAAMMADRALLAMSYLSDEGLFSIQIGDDEAARSRLVLESVGLARKNSVVVRRGIKNVQAQFANIDRLTLGHDLIHIYGASPQTRIPHLTQSLESVKAGKWDTFWRGTDRPTMRYELLGVHPDSGQWRWEEGRARRAVAAYDEYLREEAGEKTLDEWYTENLQAGLDLDFVRLSEDDVVQYYVPPQGQRLVSDNWLDIPASGSITDFPHEKAMKLLQRVIAWNTRAGDWTMDFFAGSGSFSHAAMTMPDGSRKCISMESGDYFEGILRPRLKTAMHSTGGSCLVKYIRLESYEDALNNLSLRRTENQDQLLDEHPDLREDYTLRYMLDVESEGSASLLDLDQFEDPFNYTLQIGQGSVGETRPVTVDLLETFNYLIGLRVRHIDSIRGFKVVEGASPQGERVLVIWRNTREISNADLDDFFQKQGYSTRDTEFDVIYVNGDNNLENLRRPDETWKVRLIEDDFKRLMFDVEDV